VFYAGVGGVTKLRRRDEERRIAANVAKLPELLGRRQTWGSAIRHEHRGSDGERVMTVYHVYALVGIFAVLAASIWLAWYLDRKKAHHP
jgi:hypothetical protein